MTSAFISARREIVVLCGTRGRDRVIGIATVQVTYGVRMSLSFVFWFCSIDPGDVQAAVRHVRKTIRLFSLVGVLLFDFWIASYCVFSIVTSVGSDRLHLSSFSIYRHERLCVTVHVPRVFRSRRRFRRVTRPAAVAVEICYEFNFSMYSDIIRPYISLCLEPR